MNHQQLLLKTLEALSVERNDLNEIRNILISMGCTIPSRPVPTRELGIDDLDEVFEAYYRSREQFLKAASLFKKKRRF